MANMDSGAFLTVKEAASYLRIHANTFYIWMRQKDGPPVIKLRHSRARIPKAAFLKWVEGQQLKGARKRA
jgi:excisionase family DNA binding protein